VTRYLGLLVTYRGREGTWAWLFHRLSGIGIWLFVVLHVIDIYLVGSNPHAYDDLLTFYASVPGRFLEVLLGAALLYHALNGMRIIIIDLWPAMTVHHRRLWWGSWVIFLVVGIPGAIIILRPLWKDAAESIFGLLRPMLGL
jgi:succinate dehydrogenase / fumarate reductase, cytochrome b subunit